MRRVKLFTEKDIQEFPKLAEYHYAEILNAWERTVLIYKKDDIIAKISIPPDDSRGFGYALNYLSANKALTAFENEQRDIIYRKEIIKPAMSWGCRIVLNQPER